MLLPYNEDAFKEEQVVQKNEKYPFWSHGERRAKIYSERVNVHLDSYRPLSLDTLHDTDKHARLVYESPPEYIDAKVIEVERQYATIPGKWSEYITYNWEVPGIASEQTKNNLSIGQASFYEFHRNDAVSNAYFQLKGITNYGVTYGFFHRFNVANHGLFSGGSVNISLNFGPFRRVIGNLILTSRSFSTTRLAQIVHIIGDNLYFFPNTVVSGWRLSERYRGGNISINTVREPQGQAVTARVDHEYFHATNPDTVWSPTEPFHILDPASKQIGGVTVSNAQGDTIKDSTTPNWNTYQQWIDDKKWLQAEPSKLSRWLGNIWEVTTVYVRAM